MYKQSKKNRYSRLHYYAPTPPPNRGIGETFQDAAEQVARDVVADTVDEAINLRPPSLQRTLATAGRSAGKMVREGVPQSQRQRQHKKEKTRTKTKVDDVKRKNKMPVGKRSRGRSEPYEEPQSMDRTSAYEAVRPGVRANVTTPTRQVLYYTPTKDQDFAHLGPASTAQGYQTSRTHLKTVDFSRVHILSPKNAYMESQFKSIFNSLKQEVIIGTNGGTGTTKDNFKYDDVCEYYRVMISATFLLAMLKTWRTWNPPYDEYNTVISRIKENLNVDTTLQRKMLTLEQNLDKFCIPEGILTYAQWLFQFNKKSPVIGGVHEAFVNPAFMRDIESRYIEPQIVPGGGTVWKSVFPRLCEQLDNCIKQILEEGNFNKYPSISALLLSKCTGHVTLQGIMKSGANYPEYNSQWNAILDNLPYTWSAQDSNDDWVKLNSLTGAPGSDLNVDKLLPVTDTETVKVALPFDKDSIQTHVLSHWILNYGFMTSQTTASGDYEWCGFPFFSIQPFVNDDATKYSTDFILVNNDDPDKWYIDFRYMNSEADMIINQNYRIKSGELGTYYKPSGLNTQAYAPSYLLCQDTLREWMFDLWGMDHVNY